MSEESDEGSSVIGCGRGMIVLAIAVAILIICTKIAWSIVVWAWNL